MIYFFFFVDQKMKLLIVDFSLNYTLIDDDKLCILYLLLPCLKTKKILYFSIFRMQKFEKCSKCKIVVIYAMHDYNIKDIKKFYKY